MFLGWQLLNGTVIFMATENDMLELRMVWEKISITDGGSPHPLPPQGLSMENIKGNQ